MSSGSCVRLVLLSLLACGQPADVFGYTSGESSHLNPLVQLHGDFPSSTKPASASFSQSSFQPEGFPGPSYHQGSSANLQRAAVAPWNGGYRASYGRPLDRTLLERGASSFRRTPVQQRFQTGLNAKGVPPKFLSAQRKRYALGIVSSPAIEMHFGRPESKAEPQQHSHLVQPQQPSRPIFHPDQLQQLSQQVWPQQQDRPQHSVPQPQPLHLSHPVFRLVRPQPLVYDTNRRKSDIWRYHVPPTENIFASDVSSSSKRVLDSGSESEAQPQQPSYLTRVQPTDSNSQTGAEAGRPRSFGKVLVYGPGW
ncbi:hypothetical protein Q5P01_018786 [Channa striata]|uniref:Uncharacterized protein n=1 Tax=Channa striata TaxID=64152 RepID=A0AA88S8T4_CHASR|nr:hypothetical protein Q5P01_018786 [Channa striata]